MADDRKILDLDQMVPTERAVLLKGKEFDVTRVPFEVLLLVVQNFEKMQALNKDVAALTAEELEGAIALMRQITAKLLGQNADFDEEWLKTLDAAQMYELMMFCVEPIVEKLSAEKGSSKNAEGGGVDSASPPSSQT